MIRLLIGNLLFILFLYVNAQANELELVQRELKDVAMQLELENLRFEAGKAKMEQAMAIAPLLQTRKRELELKLQNLQKTATTSDLEPSTPQTQSKPEVQPR